ncbi:hypothetical protein ACE6H2_006857 [Prunus campanulata]
MFVTFELVCSSSEWKFVSDSFFSYLIGLTYCMMRVACFWGAQPFIFTLSLVV